MPIRPLSFRELLDEPFALIQANIVVLAVSIAAGLAIAELVVVAVTAGVSHLTRGSDQGTAWAAVLSTAVCAWLLRFALRGMTVAFGLASASGELIGWRTALTRMRAAGVALLVFHVMFTLIGVSVLALGSLLIVTFPFALIWLGYLRAQRFVAVPVMFGEGASHATAMARSKLLVGGAEWPTAGLWLCQRGLMVLLAVPLLGIPWYLSDFSGTHRWPVIVLLTAAVLLIASFGEVMEAATRVVSYTDRRCRREGLDIRLPSSAGR
ncbi:hypothetical protein [Nocardia australiensis]|uniref:hypothetical protein n=1 Tax=Nocardia australiensis TaxID=2887191 RepID=UPI001D15E2B8|nr:hypothetical protein [Nocardia australiensis]